MSRVRERGPGKIVEVSGKLLVKSDWQGVRAQKDQIVRCYFTASFDFGFDVLSRLDFSMSGLRFSHETRIHES